MDENQKIKREFITSFFDAYEASLEFLYKLAGKGHKLEAMTLCLVYIDRFAQCLYWPSNLTGSNFVKALIQFGGDPLMALADPSQAICAFEKINKGKCDWKALEERISSAFPGPPYKLLPTPTLEGTLAKHVTPAELAKLGFKLKKEMWQTTIANVVYQHLRNPAVHGFGPSGGIILLRTTWEGHPEPIIGFCKLQSCARGVIAEARRRSEANCQWFGNDEIVGIVRDTTN